MRQLRPGVRLGPYRLGRKLAHGGMGDVYLAYPRSGVGEPLALKVLHRSRTASERAVQKFRAEARLTSCLSHPNLVEVFDSGENGGWHYLAMELVDGVTLAELWEALRKRKRHLPIELVSFLGRGILSALSHVHGQVGDDRRPLKVVHRDVTPNNVMVSTRGEVKLIDFGIAHGLHVPSDTVPGTLRGTLEYVAPEQLRGRPVDGRTDVHGAAVTIFFAATGRSAFWRGNERDSLEAVLDEPLPDLLQLRADAPLSLCTALRKATEKSPDGRFSSAADFQRALPPVSSRAPAELGKLVRELCGQAVAQEGRVRLATLEESRRAALWGGALGLSAALFLAAGVVFFSPPRSALNAASPTSIKPRTSAHARQVKKKAPPAATKQPERYRKLRSSK
ncbi:MAG: serine/threonine protein kinase [Myxococcota bacterium]